MTTSRTSWCLAGALAVGLAIGAFKGDSSGLRGALGNLSAPWLLVALVPGSWARGPWRGAAIGTACTLLALVGFYASATASVYGHLGGASGPLASFAYVLGANRIWFVAGLVSGPVLGAVGGLLGPARRIWCIGLAGLLMMGELVAVWAVQGRSLPVVHVGWAVMDWHVYEVQALVGAAVVLVATLRARGPARRPR